VKIRIVKKKQIKEISASGAVAGYAAPLEDLEEQKEELDELYSTSGAMMGSGSGHIPHERSPEGHKRYVRIRFTRQGLQNFKPNRYFPDKDQQLGEEWSRKERNKRKKNCSNPKGFTMKQFCKNQRTKSKKREKKNEVKDPKTGTGKKPKGSGRRLYTDEDPSDTVSVKFSTVQDIKDTFSKASFKSKSHKRQSQIINLVHQRARAAYKNAKDPETKKRLKKAYEYAEKRKEASKEKTKRMNK